MDLGAPVNVSPFIKFCRWGLLLAGIGYGSLRYKRLKKREDEHRAYIAKMKPIWDEKIQLEKRKNERKDLLGLAKDMKIPIPKDFDQRYPPVN